METEYSYFFDCQCYSHLLRVIKFKDDSSIYFDKYFLYPNELSLWQRIKLGLGFIFKPSKFDMHGNIILSQQDAEKLGEYLLKMTENKE